MTELEQYIERQNAIRRIFDQPEITLPLDHDDKQSLELQLEADFSPENLCCDGELRGEALRQKREFLEAVERQLAAA